MSVAFLPHPNLRGSRKTAPLLLSSFQSLGQMAVPLLGGFLYGIHHDYAFAGLVISIWLYFAIFLLFARKRLVQ